jgi:hypothetical protein
LFLVDYLGSKHGQTITTLVYIWRGRRIEWLDNDT